MDRTLIEMLSKNLSGGTEGNHEEPPLYSQCPGRDLNLAPHVYEFKELLLRQPDGFLRFILILSSCKHNEKKSFALNYCFQCGFY
jgi:hypothetical protein